jgi:hypothetical protein
MRVATRRPSSLSLFDHCSKGGSVPTSASVVNSGQESPARTQIRAGATRHAKRGRLACVRHSVRAVGADPAFDHRSSTSLDEGVVGATSLLASFPGAGHARFLCSGGLSWNGTVATSSVSWTIAGGGWAVNLTFSPRGSARWDALSKKAFHRYLAVDLDGRVVSAALVEPSEASWSSFSGQAEIGTPSKGRAERISFALLRGSLPVHVSLLLVETRR